MHAGADAPKNSCVLELLSRKEKKEKRLALIHIAVYPRRHSLGLLHGLGYLALTLTVAYECWSVFDFFFLTFYLGRYHH